MTDHASGLAPLAGGLVVSCQAFEGEPLFGPGHMLAMARSAALGGASGIRTNGPADVAAIARGVDLPVIGLYKDDVPPFEVRITPSLRHAREIVAAGADVIAVDATGRPRPDAATLADFVQLAHEAGVALLADVSTFEEGVAAEAAGADAVSTTLAGYAGGDPDLELPDLPLVRALADRLTVPVLAEGRFALPGEVKRAFELGAFAVVVGAAITRPQWITERFVRAAKGPHA